LQTVVGVGTVFANRTADFRIQTSDRRVKMADTTIQGEKSMKNCRVIHRLLGLVVAVLAAFTFWPGLLSAQVQSQPPGLPAPPEAADSNIEPQTRGPVHEAFAEPDVFDPAPNEVVTEQPPDPVTEVPPSGKPEGNDVTWIPGYWSRDPDQQRYVWISGIWRTLPPGLEWVPGYWVQSGAGFQWVPGFWRRADLAQVSYLPQPPESLEEGPVGEPPSQDYVWVPGVWTYNTRYAWRPGFWGQCHPGWIWIPAHYVWTPSGYVFIDGHWDYDLARRGVLFAPVFFKNRFPFAAGYAFTPSIVWDASLLTNYLFCWPKWQCYCFGDFYAANYVKTGIYPWFSFHESRFGYDPFYAYYSWVHRNDRGWHQRLVSEYRDRRDHVNLRPPATWAALRVRERQPGFKPFVMPLATFARRGGAINFEKISNVRRDEFIRNDRDLRAWRENRLQLERRPRTERPEAEHRITIPKTPRGPEFKPERPERVERGRGERGGVETGHVEHFEHRPPAGPRRPEVRKGPVPKEHAARPHPAERLANPRFEPRPSNRGGGKPEPKRK
jgi:WXXGXW repeat (2 copies)